MFYAEFVPCWNLIALTRNALNFRNNETVGETYLENLGYFKYFCDLIAICSSFMGKLIIQYVSTGNENDIILILLDGRIHEPS